MDPLLVMAWTVLGHFVFEVMENEPLFPDVRASLGPLRILTG